MGDSAIFWEAERAWQEEELATEFRVEVRNPSTISRGMFSKSYTVYEVASSVADTPVQRRYSDFDWLRDILVVRFHGVAVPLLPEKRVVGNRGDDFIHERMTGLNRWMRKIAANPYLRADPTFRLFLTLTSEQEFEQAKKAALQGGAGGNPAQNVGLGHWFGVLRHYELPTDAQAAVEELETHVTDQRAHVTTTLQLQTGVREVKKEEPIG
jgi:hypothetical protein